MKILTTVLVNYFRGLTIREIGRVYIYIYIYMGMKGSRVRVSALKDS